jgi:hypothetical protein
MEVIGEPEFSYTALWEIQIMSAKSLAPDFVTVRRIALKRLPRIFPSLILRLISSARKVFASIIMISCFDFLIGGCIRIFVPMSLLLTDLSRTSAARISGKVKALATRGGILLSNKVSHESGTVVKDKSVNGS